MDLSKKLDEIDEDKINMELNINEISLGDALVSPKY